MGQSIHMKYQTQSDLQNRNIIRNPYQPPPIRAFVPSENKNNDDDGNSNINDIKEWIISYFNRNGTLHAMYNAKYQQFIDKLQNKFANSIQNIFNSNSVTDFQSFLIKQCKL